MKIFNQSIIIAAVAATLCVPCVVTTTRNGTHSNEKDLDVEVNVCGEMSYNSLASSWGLERIGAYDAWKITEGSYDVKVGIIDMGINANHPDLQGRVDSLLSKDFTSDNSPLEDSAPGIGHGTAVAGIIGAIGNNGVGIDGVCPSGVTLVSYKVLTSNDVIDAIYAAKIDGVNLLNISLDVYVNNELKNAIKNFPGLIVCAAGNNGANINSASKLPNIDSDNMIVVGATENISDTIWGNSNYGSDVVDLFAPGADILAPTKQNSYAYVSGTSIAAPYVTGAAALLLSHIPTLPIDELKNTIMQNVFGVNSLANKCVSSGVLGVNRALTNIKHSELKKVSIILNNVFYHKVTCLGCKTSYKEPHDWYSTDGNKSTCRLCKMTSLISGKPGGDYNRIGGNLQSVDEEELCEHCEEQNIVPDATFLDGLKDSLVA